MYKRIFYLQDLPPFVSKHSNQICNTSARFYEGTRDKVQTRFLASPNILAPYQLWQQLASHLSICNK